MEPSGKSSSAKGSKNIFRHSDYLNSNEPQGHSSATNNTEKMEDQLQDFREKWQKELQVSPKKNEDYEKSPQPTTEERLTDEDKAKVFYSTAVDMEKTGKMFEAVKYYKKAFDLVHDIDFKYFESLKASNNNSELTETKSLNKRSFKINKTHKDKDLLHKLQNKISGQICYPKYEQETTHISVLPIELLLYILRWVVSQDLDMRSLEMFGQVCRGFYVCSRDSEIWKLACYRVWGLHCKLDNYNNWRQMFLERPRLLFNGCYISKTTYLRHGENSFQDQFYRPWHLITYYRYFRFFPEGKVLMLTTPDEPNVCVSQLKTRTPKSPVLSGYYRLKDDRVVITVYWGHQNLKRNTKRELYQTPEKTSDIELKIMNHKNKRHIQLQWTHYSIKTRSRGVENVCLFDLVSSKFPPLWFSRVKSYSLESEGPLD